MIQMQTRLDVADNSGARSVMAPRCRAVKRKYATIGDDRRVGEGGDSARAREEGQKKGGGGARAWISTAPNAEDPSTVRGGDQSQMSQRHPRLRPGAGELRAKIT